MAEPKCVCGHGWSSHQHPPVMIDRTPFCVDCSCKYFQPVNPESAWLPVGVWPTEPGWWHFEGRHRYQANRHFPVRLVVERRDDGHIEPGVVWIPCLKGFEAFWQDDCVGPFRFAPAMVPEKPSLE
jgi:hypothetical protein